MTSSNFCELLSYILGKGGREFKAPTQKIKDSITNFLKHETGVEPVEENSDQEESSKSSPTSSSPTETPNRRKRKLYTLVQKADVSKVQFDVKKIF